MDTDGKKKKRSGVRVTPKDLKEGNIDLKKSYIFDFENKDQKKDNKKKISGVRVTPKDLKEGNIDLRKSYIFDFENKDQKKDNKQGVSQNDQQKELSELKQEVENLKKKEEQARLKDEFLNLQIYRVQENGQTIADEDMRKQSNKAFDEWKEINRKYREKRAEYDKMAERENKKKQQRKNKNVIKEDLSQTIYSDGVNTYRGEKAYYAYIKHLEDKENKEEQKKASETKYDLKQMRAFIKQQFAEAKLEANKKRKSRNRAAFPKIPLSFYGRPMKPIKTRCAKENLRHTHPLVRGID